MYRGRGAEEEEVGAAVSEAACGPAGLPWDMAFACKTAPLSVSGSFSACLALHVVGGLSWREETL